MTLRLPKLHEGQRDVWNDDARFIVLDAGRRWGKSRLGALICTTEAAQGRRVWWVWPNYPNGAVGWRMVKRLAGRIPGAEVREVERTITFPNGGYLQIKSADKPDALRGEGLDWLIVDEAAHIRKFDEAWEQSLRPALSDRQGRAMFISTPKGFNHFYDLYRAAQDNDDWAAYQFPTLTNPFINPAEIESARGDIPELVFRQEYLAEFVQLAGALFKREYFQYSDDLPFVNGWARFWDLAASTKAHASYTVGAKVGVTSSGGIFVANVVRGRWEWPDALRIIAETARSDGTGVTQGVEDVGTQKGMFQLLMNEPSLVGLPIRPVTVQTDKMTRAMPWLARAEQGKVTLMRAPWNAAFLDEVCGFPETEHDDQVDAVSGAVQMLAGSSAPLVSAAERAQLVAPSRWTEQTKPRWKRTKR